MCLDLALAVKYPNKYLKLFACSGFYGVTLNFQQLALTLSVNKINFLLNYPLYKQYILQTITYGFL